MANDKTVKDAVVCYALEYFAIMPATREMGHEEIASVCEMISCN
jgi:hypothetical protein